MVTVSLHNPCIYVAVVRELVVGSGRKEWSWGVVVGSGCGEWSWGVVMGSGHGEWLWGVVVGSGHIRSTYMLSVK